MLFRRPSSLALLLALALAAVGPVACTTPSTNTARRGGLSLKEAQAIVDAFEQKQVAPQQKIAAPSDVAQALEILKSDRIDGFPVAVASLADKEGYEALALRAQLELAWGEAELTVAEVLAQTASKLEHDLRGIEARRNLTDADKARVAADRERIATYRETDEALRLLAAEHVGDGADAAAEVIAQKPDDYVGYRIAADAARLRNHWTEFTEMVKKVEAAKPDSNGLRFLRGVEAYMRDGDASEATRHFKEAMAADPSFVRAQAQLVLVSANIFTQHAELQALKAIAPDHQIVRWAGPGIEAAYQAAKERQEAIQSALSARPSSTVSPGGASN